MGKAKAIGTIEMVRDTAKECKSVVRYIVPKEERDEHDVDNVYIKKRALPEPYPEKVIVQVAIAA